MKFHDLAIGQRFKLEGATYVKTSPVLANSVDGGERKFLARYVVVQPFDGEEPRSATSTEKMLRAEAVLDAFNTYHARCHKALERLEGAISADRLQEVAEDMEEGRLAFLTQF